MDNKEKLQNTNNNKKPILKMENTEQTDKIGEMFKKNESRPSRPLIFKNDGRTEVFIGLTKREHFAGNILSGLMSNRQINGSTISFLVELSLKATDELLKQLEKQK